MVPADRKHPVTVGLSSNSTIGSARVPDVAGQSVASAEQVMNEAGLKFTIKQSDLTGYPGSVVQQSPAAGATLPSGSIVTLTETTGGPTSVFITKP
ncbi:MAG: PASTA domain-containing protein [Pseudonocardiaceae bacterium]